MGHLARLIFWFIFGVTASLCRADSTSPAPVIYWPQTPPKGMVIVVDDSPSNAIIDAVRRLDYVVVVADSHSSQGGIACSHSVAELTALAEAVRSGHASLSRSAPILLGRGSGSALVYLTMAEAAPGAFHAAISLDFCPPSSSCQPSANVRHLAANWYVFQRNPACNAEDAGRFIDRIDNAKRVDLPPASSPPQPVPADVTALLQWLDPGIAHQADARTDVSGVPLTEQRTATASSGTLAILLSGDGGWAAIDRGIAAELAKQGVDTVGWDSLSYYWKAKTPEQAAHDLEQVIDHYTRIWQDSRIMLVGYSFGADVLPFLIARLTPVTRTKIGLAAFLGLSPNASFEFHLSDWLGGGSGTQWPTQPEIRKLQGLPLLCLYGMEEPDSACPSLQPYGVDVVRLPGDHHFDSAYTAVASRLMSAFHRHAPTVP